MSAAKKLTTFHLPADIASKLRKMAQQCERTFDEELERAVREFIDRDAAERSDEPGPSFPVTAVTGIADLSYCTGDVDAPDNARAFMRMANGTMAMVAHAFRYGEDNFAPRDIADALSGCAALLNIAVGIDQHHIEGEEP